MPGRGLTSQERGVFSVATITFAVVLLTLALAARSSEPPWGAGGNASRGLEPIDSGVVETVGPVEVLREPRSDAALVTTLRQGVVLPIDAVEGRFYSILTPCEIRGWVPAAAVRGQAPAPARRAQRLGEATFVIDPGHGGRDLGSMGADGLTERQANDAIVGRLVELLADGDRLREVTSDLAAPDAVEPPRVVLTRSSDHDARIGYRAAVASALAADAFVSVHNNADPDGPSSRPGTEVYYQQSSQESRRLAGLLHEELVATLARHRVSWRANADAGAKIRQNADGGDFYGILRHSTVPAVLVETLFISNPPEEELLRQEAVQDQIAVAFARSLTRFVVTDDPGSGFRRPRPPDPASDAGPRAACEDPA